MLNKAIFSSKSTYWGTPLNLFNKWNAIFHFTLDPCTIPSNPLGLPKFYTEVDDGLSKSWKNERPFINPPYGRDIDKWISKCYNEWITGQIEFAAILLPNRSDTKYYHNYFCSCDGYPFDDGSTCEGTFPGIRIRKLSKRVKYVDLVTGKPLTSAPFPSILVILDKSPYK